MKFRRKGDDIIQNSMRKAQQSPAEFTMNALSMYSSLLEYIQQGFEIKAVKQKNTLFNMKDIKFLGDRRQGCPRF